jgi:hypothetical protein
MPRQHCCFLADWDAGSCQGFGSIAAWRDKTWEGVIMWRIFNGRLALIGLGLLAATPAAAAIATTPDDAPAISEATRWLQLAIETTPKTTPMPTIKRMDLQKRDLPKKTGAPAGPSKNNRPIHRR